MTTLHANSPREALSRLETIVLMALPNLTSKIVRQQIASTVHILIQMARTNNGLQHISHVSEIRGMEGETIVMQDCITYEENPKRGPAGHQWSGNAVRNLALMEAARNSGMVKI